MVINKKNYIEAQFQLQDALNSIVENFQYEDDPINDVNTAIAKEG